MRDPWEGAKAGQGGVDRRLNTHNLDTKVSETNSIRHTWSYKFRSVWGIDQ